MRSLITLVLILLIVSPGSVRAQGMPPGWLAITDTPAEYDYTRKLAPAR